MLTYADAMLTYAGSLGVKSSSSVYKIGYVREEWLKLAQSMGMYVSNTPRTHFKVCTTYAYKVLTAYESMGMYLSNTPRTHFTECTTLHY